MVDDLLSLYRSILTTKDNSPEWAVHKRTRPNELVRPAIPFVGKYYSAQENKILVYASAENLAGYYCGNTKFWVGDWLDIDSLAENRHRKCFDDANLSDAFFPHVHIAPMNNGCLSTAVYYIATTLYGIGSLVPRAFYETIAFGNYGKYSIETELQKSQRLGLSAVSSNANIDYAGNKDLLAQSHDFVRADLETLKPDCIIMPASMYKADKFFIDEVRGHAIVVPIYQINSGVINRTIARKYPARDISTLTPPIRHWYEHLHQAGMTGKSKEKYLSVFTYLDYVLENDIQSGINVLNN